MCVFQERLLLIYSPRNFVSLAILICLSSCLICAVDVHLPLLLNWMKWVLSRFKKSKLDLNHLFSHSKTIMRSLCNWKMFGLVSKILVSSANKIGRALCSAAFGKSVMYTRNNNGPKIEPCGTPYFVLVHFETVFEFKYELVMWTQSYMSLLSHKLAFRILPECTTVPTFILVHFMGKLVRSRSDSKRIPWNALQYYYYKFRLTLSVDTSPLFTRASMLSTNCITSCTLSFISLNSWNACGKSLDIISSNAYK